MGLFQTIFGGEDDPVEGHERSGQYAILLNAGPDRPAVAGNGFNYAVELTAAGHDVQLFLDGKATKWPAAFASDPDRPFSHEWEQVQTLGLLTGACGYCASAFDVTDSYDDAGVDLLSDGSDHAPAVAQLADDGYEILTIG